MEDVLTDFPPPSRFFFEDLNNFSAPPPSLSPPHIVVADSNTSAILEASLLIVAVSRSSCFLLHHLEGKMLAGKLVLPEFPAAGNDSKPSFGNNSAYIFSLDGAPGVLLLLVQYAVTEERSHAVAKAVFDRIHPEKVLILSSVQSRNFRGRISNDESFAFKLESTAQRLDRDCVLVRDISFFPSGSLIDGFAASLLMACQVRKLKGTLLVTRPESKESVVMLRSVMRNILSGLEFSPKLETSRFRDALADSELYS